MSMEILIKHPVPELLFPMLLEIPTRKPDAINELLTIIQIIIQGFPVSGRYAAKLHSSQKRRKLTDSLYETMTVRINQLIHINMIYVLDRGNKKNHIPRQFSFTDEALELIWQSRKWYFTKADYTRRTNAQNIHQYTHMYPYQPKVKTIEPNYHDQFRELLPDNYESRVFIHALAQLEKPQYVFLKPIALAAVQKKNKPKQARGMFNGVTPLIYAPNRTGRQTARPYIYRGSRIMQFIRPNDDPYLDNTIIFCLDYDSQEATISAKYSGDELLFHLAQSGQNINEFIRHQYLDDLPKKLAKQIIYAWSYGSRGGSLRKQLLEYLRKTHNSTKPFDFAAELIAKLDTAFPGVKQYREQIAAEWAQKGFITAPGGVKRNLAEDVRYKNGTINHNKLLRKGMSHIIQGAGAYIARKVVIESLNSQKAKLSITVHDGFIFSCKKEDFDEALIEAGQILTKCANQVVPDFVMAHKLEWAIDGTGYL
jgi:hypothetical protein